MVQENANSRTRRCLWLAGIVVCTALCLPAGESVEGRILGHIRDNLRSGQPLIVTDLYEKVFTQPEERQVLDKLYRAFFRIPLFLVDYQERLQRYPTLQEIAAQFALEGPDSAGVLLRVMEADPRVPRFITRHRDTGEILRIDAEMVKEDARFAKPIERRLAGWEGRPATLEIEKLEGGQLELPDFAGHPVLLYVWFTGCPPCMAMTPNLIDLHGRYQARGLTIVAANADRHLGLGYGDEVIHRYAREKQVEFPVAHWNAAMDRFYGSIAIFPTSFLIDSTGTIVQHYVGYQETARLAADVEVILNPEASQP